MEIETGYFAKAKTYAEMGYALISIARVAPWFLAKELNVYSFDFLAPTDDILALKDQPDKYTREYRREILGKLKPTVVFHKLWLIAHQEQKDKVVLLCYESPEKFCHRHLVADWLGDGLGREIREIVLPSRTPSALDLFDSSEDS